MLYCEIVPDQKNKFIDRSGEHSDVGVWLWQDLKPRQYAGSNYQQSAASERGIHESSGAD